MGSITHQTHHDLFGGEPITNQHMTHQPFARHFIIRIDIILLHMGNHDVQNLLILFYPQITVPVTDDIVRSSCIESCHNIAILSLPIGNCALLR